MLKRQSRLLLGLQREQKQLVTQYKTLQEQCQKLGEKIKNFEENRQSDFLVGIAANLGINAVIAGLVTIVGICATRLKKRQTGDRTDQTVAAVSEEVPLQPARTAQPEIVLQPRENPFYRNTGPTAPALPNRIYRVRR